MSFTHDIQKYADKALLSVAQVLRTVALDVDAEVVTRSPVLTGRFRANNNVGLGQADLSEYSPDPDGNTTTARAHAVIAQATGHDVIVISNNLPYAKAIESGSSRKAPTGVYEVTLANFQAIFETAVIEVRNGRGRSD